MKLRLKFPTLRRMQFEPQPIEQDDDLARAIRNDTRNHDNVWDLTDAIDGEALERFWDEAVRDRSRDS